VIWRNKVDFVEIMDAETRFAFHCQSLHAMTLLISLTTSKPPESPSKTALLRGIERVQLRLRRILLVVLAKKFHYE